MYCFDVTVESSLNKFSLKFNYWELLQIIMIMGIIRIFVPLVVTLKGTKTQRIRDQIAYPTLEK